LATKPTRISKGERYAMNENSNIVRLRQHGEIDDPLTNILRSGARRLLAQAVEMEAEAFLTAMKDLKLPTDATALSGMATVRFARSRRGSAPSTSAARRSAIVGLTRMARKSALPRLSCRGGRAVRRAWMRFYRCSNCAASRREISRRLWRPCLARMRQTCRHR